MLRRTRRRLTSRLLVPGVWNLGCRARSRQPPGHGCGFAVACGQGPGLLQELLQSRLGVHGTPYMPAWCPCGRMKQSISGPAESKRVKSQLRNASGKQKAAVDTLTCRQPASPPCRRRHPLRRGAHGGPRIPARSGSDLHAGLSRPDERLSSSESCASVAPAPPPPPGGGGTRGGAASPAT